MVELGNAKRAGWDAIAATVANIVLYDDAPEFGADNRSGRARIEAPGMYTMLTDVTEHKPGDAVCGRTLDERNVPPGIGPEVNRIVVAEPGQLEKTR